jgi:CHAD domain-containing protein
MTSSGDHAVDLIAQYTRKLVKLQSGVLADEDPEPLHQMRVTMRRLRTCLRQFGPALVLPESVSERRIAKLGRRLGMARDLDVLRDRLVGVLEPQLPPEEKQSLEPVLKQLARERGLAGEQVAELLQSGPYLALLSRLQPWVKKPILTPLGREPLREWLIEWQVPPLASLFLHPGWFVRDGEAEADTMHDLRKRCKTARYGLENLGSITGSRCRKWAERFKGAQDLLGEFNDLRVLERAIDDQLPEGIGKAAPQLLLLLQENRRQCWRQWRQEAEKLRLPKRRRRLVQALLVEGGAGGESRLQKKLWGLIDRLA